MNAFKEDNQEPNEWDDHDQHEAPIKPVDIVVPKQKDQSKKQADEEWKKRFKEWSWKYLT